MASTEMALAELELASDENAFLRRLRVVRNADSNNIVQFVYDGKSYFYQSSSQPSSPTSSLYSCTSQLARDMPDALKEQLATDMSLLMETISKGSLENISLTSIAPLLKIIINHAKASKNIPNIKNFTELMMCVGFDEWYEMLTLGFQLKVNRGLLQTMPTNDQIFRMASILSSTGASVYLWKKIRRCFKKTILPCFCR
jgi:hypothetical protein